MGCQQATIVSGSKFAEVSSAGDFGRRAILKNVRAVGVS
jgi:hypothetical protein